MAPDDKVVKREAGRLEASITAAEKSGKTPVVFLHYPPVYSEWVCEEIFSVIKKHGIKTVWHGHIHGSGFNNAKKEFDGVKLRLLSADCVDFCPVPILL